MSKIAQIKPYLKSEPLIYLESLLQLGVDEDFAIELVEVKYGEKGMYELPARTED